MKEKTRSYVVAENKIAGNQRGSEVLLPLAIVWSNDAVGALAILLGTDAVLLHGMRYVHGRLHYAMVDASVDGTRRQFDVLAVPNIPVPVFARTEGDL